MKTISFDVDQVVFPLVEDFIPWFNNKYGTNYHPSHLNSYDFYVLLGGDRATDKAHLAEYQRDGWHKRCEPVPGAAAVIRSLARDYRVVATTSRFNSWRKDTYAWLEYGFAGNFSDVLFTDHDHDPMAARHTKADLARRASAVLHVDDLTHHLLQFEGTGVKPVLYGNYSWTEPRASIPHIKEWNTDAERLIRSLL